MNYTVFQKELELQSRGCLIPTFHDISEVLK